MPDAAAIERTRTACRAALEDSADLQPLWRAWRAGSDALAEARSLVAAVRAPRPAVVRLARLKQTLADDGLPVGGGAFERFLVVSAAEESAARVPALAVDERVRQLFLDNFAMYADAKTPEPFDVARASFVAMCRIATLSRFPAGQLDWVVDGVPRSWLFRAAWRDVPRLAAALAAMRGFAPAFFSHLNPNRRGRGVLLERESLRSYYRMARSMEQQPEIRGFATASWLHSPHTSAVSPHLKWLNEVFLQNGGYVIGLGRVDPEESGALHRSPERQQAFEAGTFVPTEALVIWPRAAMLAWAREHEELRDDGAVRRPLLRPQGVGA